MAQWRVCELRATGARPVTLTRSVTAASGGSAARPETQRVQQSLQVGPRPRGSALAHHHQHVEASTCLGEGLEGVPRDSNAGAMRRAGSQARRPVLQVDRDVLGRPRCVQTLLDGHQDVGRAKPVQRRCRTARDATTCPALVAERIGGDRQNLAGIHQRGSQVAPRPIPPRRQGHAVVMTDVGYAWALAFRLSSGVTVPAAPRPVTRTAATNPQANIRSFTLPTVRSRACERSAHGLAVAGAAVPSGRLPGLSRASPRRARSRPTRTRSIRRSGTC